VIGLLIYSITYNSFFVRNNLVFGGSSSVATILKDYVNPSITIMFISIVSLLLSFILMGKRFALNTLVGSLLFPLFVTLTSNVQLPIPKDDLMLVAICGAVLIGFASGIMGRTGLSSGGLDSIVHIFAKKMKISSGKAFMFVNGLIVIIGGYRFGWRILLYALIILYIIGIVTDKVVMSISMNKTFFIVTNKVEEIKEYILNNLSRGVTVLDAKGGFTKHDQEVIMAVIPSVEYFKAKEGILAIDQNAFFTITDSYQVYGQDSHRKRKRKEVDD
jgi:uncharacterized membrane-anchored protein YitT (DUF2179 family)